MPSSNATSIDYICHWCKTVRKESKMRKMKPWETSITTIFSNAKKWWCCIDIIYCELKKNPPQRHTWSDH